MGVETLTASRNAKISQKETKESEKAIVEKKVKRLKDAYDKVHTEVENARTLKSDFNNQDDFTGDEWKGTKSQQFENNNFENFKNQYSVYITRLDGIQDDINTELTKQENKVISLNGDILGLGQAINSLWNQIQNWVN